MMITAPLHNDIKSLGGGRGGNGNGGRGGNGNGGRSDGRGRGGESSSASNGGAEFVTADQSSTGWNGDASRAIDGNTNGKFMRGQ